MKPILFSAPMIRAILDGRKTQTRRVLKVPETHGHFVGIYAPGLTAVFSHDVSVPHNDFSVRLIGKGTELWVRESFADTVGMGFDKRYHYAADVKPGSESDQIRKDYGVKWKPSIHMPRAASRITLRVTAVKVERLQDISEEDALAEGVGIMDPHHPPPPIRATYAEMYRDLWDSINGPGSWDANPWVVAYTFERVLPK